MKNCVVHILGEDFLVLLHPVDEKPFKGLDEHVAEVVERVRGGGLPQFLVGDVLFAKLLDEEFVGLCKISKAGRGPPRHTIDDEILLQNDTADHHDPAILLPIQTTPVQSFQDQQSGGEFVRAENVPPTRPVPLILQKTVLARKPLHHMFVFASFASPRTWPRAAFRGASCA